MHGLKAIRQKGSTLKYKNKKILVLLNIFFKCTVFSKQLRLAGGYPVSPGQGRGPHTVGQRVVKSGTVGSRLYPVLALTLLLPLRRLSHIFFAYYNTVTVLVVFDSGYKFYFAPGELALTGRSSFNREN